MIAVVSMTMCCFSAILVVYKMGGDDQQHGWYQEPDLTGMENLLQKQKGNTSSKDQHG